MSRWFRFYDDALNDPKVQRLSADLFKAWINLLCLASKSGGELRCLGDVAFSLRLSEQKAAVIVTSLASAGLLDRIEDRYFAPHNWGGRQYQSDYSAERVKKYRQRRADAGLVQQWQAPKALKEAVFARDGNKCVYCGSGEKLSIDHKTPVQRGGTDDIENLQIACRSCNASKRDMTHDEFTQRNVSVTETKRHQKEQSRTDSEAEKEEDRPKREARLRTPYPEDFENEFWKPYPTSPNMSKSEALSAWKGLSEEERKLATAAVPAFKRWLSEQRDHPVVHAVRFLKQRRFEGFTAQGPPASNVLADELAIIRRQIAEAANGKAESSGDGREWPDNVEKLRPAGAASR